MTNHRPTKKGKPWTIVCATCLEVSEAEHCTPGSDGVEVLLMILTIPLLCVGGILYHGLRRIHGHWACPVCAGREIVPYASARGRELRRRAANLTAHEPDPT